MPRYKLEWYDGEDQGFSTLRNADLETVQHLTDYLLRTGVRSVNINEDRLDGGVLDAVEGTKDECPSYRDMWAEALAANPPPSEPTRYGTPI